MRKHENDENSNGMVNDAPQLYNYLQCIVVAQLPYKEFVARIAETMTPVGVLFVCN